MLHRNITFYVTDSGRCPVRDYIAETERKRRDRATIVSVLELISCRPILPKNIFKKLKGRDNLWEIRVARHRLLCFPNNETDLVIVHAFFKATQKTPPQEIDLAIRRKSAYISSQRP